MMCRRSFCVATLGVLLVGSVVLAAACSDQSEISSLTTGAAVTTTEQPVTTTTEPETTTTTTAAVALVEDGWLLGVALPSSVPEVVEKLGEPDEVGLPDLAKDPSPWPQQFRWKIAGGNYTFTILAEAYSDTTPDYEAKVYCTVLRRDADVASQEVLDGMSLGITNRAEVQMSFGDQVRSNDLATRWQFDDTGTYVSSLSRVQDGIFTFYLFDQEDVLVGLVQATYDLGGVD